MLDSNSMQSEQSLSVIKYFTQVDIFSVNESEFKAIIKRLHILHQQDLISLVQVSSIIAKHLKSVQNVSEAELSGALNFFRIFAEDPTCKITSILCPVDTVLVFANIIFPQVTTLIQHSKAECYSTHQKSASLLHKTVRLMLNLIKAITSEDKAKEKTQQCDFVGGDKDERIIEIGIKFLDFLNNHPGAKLDIKFNAGLTLCHLMSRKFLESLFDTTTDYSTSAKSKTSIFEDAVLVFTQTDHLNKLAIGFGALRTCGVMSTDFLTGIAYSALTQSENSIKEAENIGTARVLEIWLQKVVSEPTIQLEKLSKVFLLVEIFIFTYLQGHIDFVKNCCRNMLTDLSVVYHRLDKENVLIRQLLEKILTKPYHIKWTSLAAVAKNPHSVVLLDIWKDAAEKLLCADRVFKTAASDVYISLMRYTFNSTSDKTLWIKDWIYPLFRTQPSQNNVSNWPQKKYILSKVMVASETESESKAAVREMNLQQTVFTTIIDAMAANPTVPTTQPSLLLSTESSCLVVECMKIGTELGIKINCSSDTSAIVNQNNDLFRGVLPRNMFNSWTCHTSPQIRLAAFSLLVETKKTSEILSARDFQTLQHLFKYNIVSQNPAFRQQFQSYFKRLMRRLKDGRSFAKRNKMQEDVENYEDFLHWLWKFFTNDGLFLGANFSRRYQSLLCLSELLRNFKTDELLEINQPQNFLNFLRWLNDTYENNKIASLEILTQLPISEFEDEKFCNQVFDRAINLLLSVKPPDTVTGRYLLLLVLKKSSLTAWNLLEILLTKLETLLESIKKGSLQQVSTSPPFGLIRAIRNIFESYHKEILEEALSSNRENSVSFNNLQAFTTRLLHFSLQLDDILLPVLASAAPEGFLPCSDKPVIKATSDVSLIVPKEEVASDKAFLPDLNENENENPENSNIVRSMQAQMLLVSSWRSMKETCILLTEMCVNFPFQGELKSDLEFVLSFDQVSSIGTHLVYLLMNLMHRGVFEQVFVGLKSLAVRLKKSQVSRYNKLSKIWLQEVFDTDKVGDKSTTRRSAGLPFIFQALLIPEANNETFMEYWMEMLMKPNPNMTIRIHSTNILRALCRDSNFAQALMGWIPCGIQLAFHGLKANEWAERNSGLMLFGSVIRRTFGPRLNLLSAPTFFRKFPQMYDFLLSELKATTNAVSTNNDAQHDNDLLYHLLLLFSCFSSAPGKSEEGPFKLWEFVPYIQACGSNRDIQVRTIAAKGLVPFVTSSDDRKTVLESTLDNLLLHSKKMRNNLIHGDLLQLIAILKLIKSYSEEISVHLIEKFQLIIDIVKNTKCPTIFENFACLSMDLADFDQQNLMSTAITMQKVTELAFIALFPLDQFSRRNSIAGLPDADSEVCKSVVKFELSEENICRWIKDGSSCMVQELMVMINTNFDSNSDGDYPVSDDGTTSKLQHVNSCSQDGNLKRKLSAANNCQLMKRYLQEEFHFEGQTDIEMNYLVYFSHCDENDFYNCSDVEIERMMDKLVVICQADFGSGAIKATALKFLAKLALNKKIEMKRVSKYKEIVCELFVEWAHYNVDDELRLGVASSLPTVPLDFDHFSAIEFCKIWTSLFKLAQDDETFIRCEALKKLSSDNQVPGCSLKCIELLVQVFLQQLYVGNYTVEGLWALFGWLMTDNCEIMTRIPDDDEEDRLFDPSEMNLFQESMTLTNIVLQYLESNREILDCLKLRFCTPLNSEGYQYFLRITNVSSSVNVNEDTNYDQSNYAKLKHVLITPIHGIEKDCSVKGKGQNLNENLLQERDYVNFDDLLSANSNDNMLVQRCIRHKIAKLFLHDDL